MQVSGKLDDVEIFAEYDIGFFDNLETITKTELGQI
jgi:hypothetical protein